MAKKISELPVVDTAQAADKVLINHDGTTSTILVEDLLPVEAELDDIPTAGSSNAVTSGGVYTALQSAGSIPDWDENGETAVDFIKNRPFYREVVSSTTVFSITGSDARTTSTNGTMDFTESYSASELLVVGKEYRVIIYHASATFEERIIASKYNANNIRLTGSAFYIEQNTGNLEIKATQIWKGI